MSEVLYDRESLYHDSERLLNRFDQLVPSIARKLSLLDPRELPGGVHDGIPAFGYGVDSLHGVQRGLAFLPSQEKLPNDSYSPWFIPDVNHGFQTSRFLTVSANENVVRVLSDSRKENHRSTSSQELSRTYLEAQPQAAQEVVVEILEGLHTVLGEPGHDAAPQPVHAFA